MRSSSVHFGSIDSVVLTTGIPLDVKSNQTCVVKRGLVLNVVGVVRTVRI